MAETRMSSRNSKEILEAQIASLDVLLEKNRNELSPNLAASLNAGLQLQRQNLVLALETGTLNRINTIEERSNTDEAELSQRNIELTEDGSELPTQSADPNREVTTLTKKPREYSDSSDDTSSSSEYSDEDSSSEDGRRKLKKKKKKKHKQRKKLKKLRRKGQKYEETYEHKPLLSTIMPSDVISFLREFDGWERKLKHRFKLRKADLMICIHHTVLEQLAIMQVDTEHDGTIREYLNGIRDEFEEERKQTLFDRISQIHYNINTGSLLTGTQSHIMKIEEEIANLELGHDAEKRLCKLVLETMPAIFLKGNLKNMIEQRSLHTWPSVKAFLLKSSKTISQFDWNLVDLRTRQQINEGVSRIYPAGSGKGTRNTRSKKQNKVDQDKNGANANQSVTTVKNQSKPHAITTILKGYKPIKCSLEIAQQKLREMRNSETYSDVLKAQLINCYMNGLCTKCRSSEHPSSGCTATKEQAIRARREYQMRNQLDIPSLLKNYKKQESKSANQVNTGENAAGLEENRITDTTTLNQAAQHISANPSANMVTQKDVHVTKRAAAPKENVSYWIKQLRGLGKGKATIDPNCIVHTVVEKKLDEQVASDGVEMDNHPDLQNSKIEISDHNGIIWRNYKQIRSETLWKNYRPVIDLAAKVEDQQNLSMDETLMDYDSNWEVGYGENTRSDYPNLKVQKKEEEAEIKEIIKKQVEKAKLDGILTDKEAVLLMETYYENLSAFGIRQSIAQMSSLPPMPVIPKPDAKPFRAAARDLNRIKKEAMRTKIKDLVAMGMLQHEPNPLYSSPAFMVPKKNNKWRMVIDLRELNNMVEVSGASLVDLEAQLNWLPQKIKFIASLDALSGFDMLPISEDAAKYFNISTPFGCYKLLGSPMGFINTPFVYSTRMISYILGGHNGVFGAPNHGCLQWLDDSLVYATTFTGFLSVLRTILKNCIKYSLRLNANKCIFVTKTTEWCGRTISSNGWNFSTKHFNKILSMACPKTLGQLEDILYVSAWLAPAIPKLSTLKAELQKLATDLKKKLFLDRGRRVPRKFRSKMSIVDAVEYGTLKETFYGFKKLIAASANITLQHMSPEKQLEIYTDASDTHWAAVITIVEKDNQDIVEHQNIKEEKKVENKDPDPSKDVDVEEGYSGKHADSAKFFEYEQNFSFTVLDRVLNQAEEQPLAISKDKWALAGETASVNLVQQNEIKLVSKETLNSIQKWRGKITIEASPDIYIQDALDCIKEYQAGTLSLEETVGVLVLIQDSIPRDPEIIQETINELEKDKNETDFKYINHLLASRKNPNILVVNEARPEKFRLTDDQIVKPVYFLSGTFKGPELAWSVSEKEMVPIIKSLLRFEYMTCGTKIPIRILTDHRNLIYIFSPPKTVKASSLSRLQRWAIMLQKFHLEVLHYSGEHNRFADLLSRWGFPVEVMKEPINIIRNTDKDGNILFGKIKLRAQAVTTRERNKTINPLDLEKEPLPDIIDEKADDPSWFKWRDCRISFLHPSYKNKWEAITIKELKQHQKEVTKNPSMKIKNDLLVKEDKILIPNSLVPRLIFHTHIAEGHSSVDSEMFHLEKFSFEISKRKLREYLNRLHVLCLHCDEFPALVRRPIGRLPHAKRPNILLHTDYISIYNGYLLSIVDDFSRKTWLFYQRHCNVEGYIEGITSWAAILGLSGRAVIASDKGSHFCNQIAKELDRRMGYSRRLSIAYSPWSNGPVERRNREIIRIFRSLTSELGLPLSKWRKLLNTVMGHINNHPIKSKGNLTPNQIYSGRDIEGKILGIDPELRNPLVRSNIEIPAIPIWDQERFIQYENKEFFYSHMKQLIQELNTNDNSLQSYLLRERDRHQKRFNKNIHPDQIQYGIGDYIMFSIAGTSLVKDKLQLRWLGPAIIKDIIGENLYLVQDLMGNEMEVHSRRIRFYDGKEQLMTEEIKEVYLYNAGRFQLEKILDLQEIDNRTYLKVKWRGLDALDTDWQLFDTLWIDAKYTIIKYLEKERNESSLARSLYRDYVIPYKKQRKANIMYVKKYPKDLRMEGDDVLPFLAQSKGWSPYEDLLLKRSIRCHGFGEWDKILRSYILPGKTRAQIIDRAKTLVGSQSIFQYHGLRINVDLIKKYNDNLVVPRKNGIIVNTGRHLTIPQRRSLKRDTWEKYNSLEEPLPLHEIGIPRWKCISNNKLTNHYKKELLAFWGQAMQVQTNAIGSQPRLYLKVAPEEDTFIAVRGILDSGATITCMDLKQWPLEAEKYIYRNDPYHKKYSQLFDANGKSTPTEGYIITEVTIQCLEGEVLIPEVRIILMKSPGWNYLLLGNDVLERLEITPQKLLERKLKELKGGNNQKPEILLAKDDETNIELDKNTFIRELENNLQRETQILLRRKRFKEENAPILKALIHFYYDNYDKTKIIFKYNGIICKMIQKLDNTYEVEIKEDVFELFIAPKYATYIQGDILSEQCWNSIKGMKFKALIVDPPWTQAGTSPTRGVTIPFKCLSDAKLLEIPLDKYLPAGYLFLWVVNNKIEVAKEWMLKYDFRFLDYIIWDKRTINNKPFTSQGNYLRHGKEVCILAKRGDSADEWRKQRKSDLFKGRVTTPMRKPIEFYQLIEECLPGGLYLELFGRTHNLRDYWTTIGDEVDPSEDKDLLEMFKPYGFNHQKGGRCNDDVLFV
eukprot:snap_masked-scaffold_87-processed-gene-0.29-mRNA-1 protein AED:0.37 eAED:0.37 QI:0/-1/0/1/-1/1/1/0/2646